MGSYTYDITILNSLLHHCLGAVNEHMSGQGLHVVTDVAPPLFTIVVTNGDGLFLLWRGLFDVSFWSVLFIIVVCEVLDVSALGW